MIVNFINDWRFFSKDARPHPDPLPQVGEGMSSPLPTGERVQGEGWAVTI